VAVQCIPPPSRLLPSSRQLTNGSSIGSSHVVESAVVQRIPPLSKLELCEPSKHHLLYASGLNNVLLVMMCEELNF